MLRTGSCADKYDELALELGRGAISRATRSGEGLANLPTGRRTLRDRRGSDGPGVCGENLHGGLQTAGVQGQRKTRMPGWTDRILVAPRQLQGKIQASDGRAITSQFDVRHSPVQAIFTLQTKKLRAAAVHAAPSNVRVRKADGSPSPAEARHLKVVAPSPFEVDADCPATAKKLTSRRWA